MGLRSVVGLLLIAHTTAWSVVLVEPEEQADCACEGTILMQPEPATAAAKPVGLSQAGAGSAQEQQQELPTDDKDEKPAPDGSMDTVVAWLRNFPRSKVITEFQALDTDSDGAIGVEQFKTMLGGMAGVSKGPTNAELDVAAAALAKNENDSVLLVDLLDKVGAFAPESDVTEDAASGTEHSYTRIQANPDAIEDEKVCSCKRDHGRKPRKAVVCNKPMKPYIHNYDPDCFDTAKPLKVDAPDQSVLFKLSVSGGGQAESEDDEDSAPEVVDEDQEATKKPVLKGESDAAPAAGAAAEANTDEAVTPTTSEKEEAKDETDTKLESKIKAKDQGAVPTAEGAVDADARRHHRRETRERKRGSFGGQMARAVAESMGVSVEDLEVGEITQDPVTMTVKVKPAEGTDPRSMVDTVKDAVTSGKLKSAMENNGLEGGPALMAIRVPPGTPGQEGDQSVVEESLDPRHLKEKTPMALRVPAVGRDPIQANGGGFVEDTPDAPVTPPEDLAAMGAGPASSHPAIEEWRRQTQYAAELRYIRERLAALDAEEAEVVQQLNALRIEMQNPPAFPEPPSGPSRSTARHSFPSTPAMSVVINAVPAEEAEEAMPM